MNKALFWVIQCLPFVKRIFYWNDLLYLIFNYLPALLALRARVNINFAFLYAVIGLYFIIGQLNTDAVMLYFIGLMPLLFSSQFSNVGFHRLMGKYWLIPSVIVLYGIYQKLSGYSFFELGWINSGKGKVGPEGLFLSDDIRPFSLLAGIPEYSLFICIMIYHEIFVRGKYLTSVFFIGMLLLTGSRGILMGLFLTLPILTFLSRKSKALRFVVTISLGVAAYVFLVFLGDILWEFEGSGNRMLVYGTFNARSEIVVKFFEQLSFPSIMLGVGLPSQTFDNIYITILNDFGIIGIIILIYLLYVGATDHKSEFAMLMALIFGMFSDFVHSFFFMHLLTMMLYTQNDLLAKNNCWKSDRYQRRNHVLSGK